ncbi:MAG: hypothetical protein R3D27_09040 [Hyphomicrobiaceae bacterium]
MVSGPLRLTTLLGDHTASAALKRGEIVSPLLTLEFADVKVPNTAFKRVVRDLEFDVAELAIVTFLMAKARGVPLSLLPVVLMSRAQHPFLVHDAKRGVLVPRDLEGRRVAIRSWSVTTAVWIRDILRQEGVAVDRVRWVTLEDAHVAGIADPPGVERAPTGADIKTMLATGDVDAAVLGAVPDDPRFRPVFEHPGPAAQEWQRLHRAIQINHMLVVKQDLCRAEPAAVRALVDMCSRARAAAAENGVDLPPFGIDANRRSLEVAIDATFRDGLIPTRPFVEDLFDDVVRNATSD